MIVLYYLLQWTWGLPQNLVGLLLMLTVGREGRQFYHGAVTCHWGKETSMGMGMFIFLGTCDRTDPSVILVHEFGHTLQSMILGPGYLLFIGLPSVIWNATAVCRDYRHRHQISYYSFYPERWANALGHWITGGRTPT